MGKNARKRAARAAARDFKAQEMDPLHLEPEVVKEPAPEVVKKPAPEVVKKPAPEVVKKPVSSWAREMEELDPTKEPEVVKVTKKPLSSEIVMRPGASSSKVVKDTQVPSSNANKIEKEKVSTIGDKDLDKITEELAKTNIKLKKKINYLVKRLQAETLKRETAEKVIETQRLADDLKRDYVKSLPRKTGPVQQPSSKESRKDKRRRERIELYENKKKSSNDADPPPSRSQVPSFQAPEPSMAQGPTSLPSPNSGKGASNTFPRDPDWDFKIMMSDMKKWRSLTP
jgi:hypothetical protein